MELDMSNPPLIAASELQRTLPKSGQLLKWIGNKHRSAESICSHIPRNFDRYFEPFLGGGAVLATLAPHRAVASDTLDPLISLWKKVQSDPESVLIHYTRLWNLFEIDRKRTYSQTLERFNSTLDPLDLMFLCRTCYGGVIRFTKIGKMSTPLGPHNPISPAALERRLEDWSARIRGTEFASSDFTEIMSHARSGDIIYCDPPYSFAQSIIYGSQSFELGRLWRAVHEAKNRGARILVSIDGTKNSGQCQLDLDIPKGLFARELFIPKGGSMLKRLQRNTVNEKWIVEDRLLLTW